ncbi:MAG: hypothetical protein JW384_01714 [Nitrosomonadaceae bacterium]|nr:hypothetical protein [Nitrosomonadaceae bacterium]
MLDKLLIVARIVPDFPILLFCVSNSLDGILDGIPIFTQWKACEKETILRQ